MPMLSCRDYESFPWAFHTPPRMYFMYKFDFLFWRRCLLDHLVQMYAWCLNLSFLDLADDCRNSVGPGVRLGPCSFILIHLAVVFMLLHKCEFIRIEYVKFCVVMKFSEALSLKKLLFFLIGIFLGELVDAHAVVQKLLLKWREGRGSDLEADRHLSLSSEAEWKKIG